MRLSSVPLDCIDFLFFHISIVRYLYIVQQISLDQIALLLVAYMEEDYIICFPNQDTFESENDAVNHFTRKIGISN